MDWFPLIPRRCLCCGAPAPGGGLCRACAARFPPGTEVHAALGPCPLCGQPRLAELGPCVDCSQQAWSFALLDGVCAYHDPQAELIRLYKGDGQRMLARRWANTLFRRLDPPAPLVPVPPLSRNFLRRGWDPVAVLTAELSRLSRQPVLSVLRRRPSPPQKTLDRSGRWQNAKQAYRLVRSARLRLSRLPLVWLVDDVVTTGATVESCAQLLREAGVGEVRVWCLGLH